MTGTQSVDQLLKETLERLHKLENQLVQQGGSISAASQSVFDGGYITNPTYFENIAQINDKWEELDYDGFLQKLYRTATNEPEDSPFEDRDAELRWWDETTGYYINAFPFLLTVDEESTPWLLIDQALAVRKDFYALGMLTSGEGVLNMYGGVGWGPDGFDSNPFVWLAKGGDYGTKDILEIRITESSAWAWGGLSCGDLLCESLGDVDATEVNLKANLIPETNATYNLGSETKALNKIYSAYGYIGDLTCQAALRIDYMEGYTDVDLVIVPYAGNKVEIQGDLNVTGSIVGGISDKGSATTLSDGTGTVTFNKTFDFVPLVICQPIDYSGRGVRLDVTAKSTTQFSVKASVLPANHKHKVGQATATSPNPFEISSESSHTHSLGSHKHKIGSISATSTTNMETANESSHTHSIGSHKHKIGSVSATSTTNMETANESSHTHSIGSHKHKIGQAAATASWDMGISSNSAGTPSGSLSSAGSHGHYMLSPSTTTTVVTAVNNDGGTYGHDVGGYSGWIEGGSPGSDHYHGSGEYKTSMHSTTTTTVAANNHNHTIVSSGNHTHTFSGNAMAAHGHTLTDKAPYSRGINLRDINGNTVETGATMMTITDTAKDLYTEASSGTSGTGSAHKHGLQFVGGYTIYHRGLTLRDSGGSNVAAGALINETTYAAQDVYTEGSTGSTGAGTAHKHSLQFTGGYTIYHRGLTLRNSSGGNVTAGATIAETTYTAEDLYTEESSGTTGTGSAHSHTLSYTGGAPIYVRNVNLRDINGAAYGIGTTLENETKTATDLYTEAADFSEESLIIDFDWIAVSV